MEAFISLGYIADKITGKMLDVEFSFFILKGKKFYVHVQYILRTKKPYSRVISDNCSEEKFEHIKETYHSTTVRYLYGCEESIKREALRDYNELLRNHDQDVGWYNNQQEPQWYDQTTT